jgi:lipoprotein-anchoring transpeptidase ErfK/SrfK
MAGPSRRTRVGRTRVGRIRVGRLNVAAALIALFALVVTTGCSGPRAQWQDAGGRPAGTPAPQAAKLTFSHENNASGISPAEPITVAVDDGRLTSVALTNAEGKEVTGEYDAAKTSWKSSEPLGYDKAYTLVVSSTGDDGKTVQETRTFTTLKPSNFTLPYLRANSGVLLDGGTFGVGQPIVIWFDEAITDRAAAVSSLTVTTDPPTIGAWRWLNNHEVHWRPQEYWQSGTKVTVAAKVYGVNLGNGLYGQEDRTASFTIGQSKIAIADASTKQMEVYIGGALVRTIPVSMGKNGGEYAPNGNYIDFRTQSGPHVVMGKAEVVRMTSASYGLTDPNSPNYYDTPVKKAVHISGDGEYVHLADWNIPQHGYSNTSHGCINVAPEHIYWFYDTFGVGDVVDVRNTGRNLPLGNGISDWVLSWAEWSAPQT